MLLWKNNNIFPFIDGVDVAFSNMKMLSGDKETKCCRATKYFVLLLTIRSIKYCECLYSCPSYQASKWHFYAPCDILFCGLSGTAKFFHIFHKRQDFLEKKKNCFNIQHKIPLLIFSTSFIEDISHSRKNSVWYDHKFTQVLM